MANETTSSTISELYTEIVAEALFVAGEQSIMRNLVRNYTIAGGGKSVESIALMSSNPKSDLIELILKITSTFSGIVWF